MQEMPSVFCWLLRCPYWHQQQQHGQGEILDLRQRQFCTQEVQIKFLMLKSHVLPPLPWLRTVGSCLTASALCCRAADFAPSL